MRGIFLLIVLAGLAVAGYLSMKDTQKLTGGGSGDAKAQVEAAKKQIEDITAEHMKRLKQETQ
ncbi:MAG: hypothetical protein PVF40_10330 [Ectothiorhodospiraceae bacterium]|jgi:hypothetical protein